jgi:peptidoglycan/LPS O-acetylase OafA/YrhL
MIKKILNAFQRITISSKFIPEIDGLRFIAIISVIFFHLNTFIVNKSHVAYSNYAFRDLISNIFGRGHLGVELFFVISGLILAKPFAAHYLNDTEKPKMKDYFIRRLTRLEPPYVLSLLIFFAASLYLGKYTFDVLFPSLLASLTYTHNIVYPTQQPLINVVTWSLEIEVQFYIIAPLLARVFKLPTLQRRVVIIAVILCFSLLQNLFVVPSLLKYLQYFGIGFLLTDLLLTGHKAKMSRLTAIITGLVSFCLIWYFDPSSAGNDIGTKIVYQIMLVAAIFVFYYLVLFTPQWKRLFSMQVLTVIGGMCYSIYLLHYQLISMVGNPLISRVHLSGYYIVDYALYCIVLIIAVLIMSSVYFKLVEQPCMKRDWHINLVKKIKGIFTR